MVKLLPILPSSPGPFSITIRCWRRRLPVEQWMRMQSLATGNVLLERQRLSMGCGCYCYNFYYNADVRMCGYSPSLLNFFAATLAGGGA